MHQLILPSGGGADFQWASDHVCVKTPSDFTAGAITVVEDTLKPGFHLDRHYHKRMFEIFYILDGQVAFGFDDEQVLAASGMTVNIPPGVMHAVTSNQGCTLLTIFSPGGFDRYLHEVVALSSIQLDDQTLMKSLGEKYDIWQT